MQVRICKIELQNAPCMYKRQYIKPFCKCMYVNVYNNECFDCRQCGLFMPFGYVANVACLCRLAMWPMWPVYEENECNPHPQGPSLVGSRFALCCKMSVM